MLWFLGIRTLLPRIFRPDNVTTKNFGQHGLGSSGRADQVAFWQMECETVLLSIFLVLSYHGWFCSGAITHWMQWGGMAGDDPKNKLNHDCWKLVNEYEGIASQDMIFLSCRLPKVWWACSRWWAPAFEKVSSSKTDKSKISGGLQYLAIIPRVEPGCTSLGQPMPRHSTQWTFSMSLHLSQP